MLKLKDWAESIGVYENTDEKALPLRLLLYGESGSGKTHFALTAPNPFVIDTDRGLATALKMGVKPRFVSLSKDDQVYRITKDILLSARDGIGPFKDNPPGAVIIDSVTQLAEALLWEVMTKPINSKIAIKDPTSDKAEFDHWAALQNRMKELLDITKDLPCHVIGTAGIKRDQDEVFGGWVIQPDISGGMRNRIAHYFDEFFYMEPTGEGDKLKYITYTTKHRYSAAKSRTGRPAKLENASFKDLVEGGK